RPHPPSPRRRRRRRTRRRGRRGPGGRQARRPGLDPDRRGRRRPAHRPPRPSRREQPMSGGFDPLVPRPIDLPTPVPLAEDLNAGAAAEALDEAKIFAAPGTLADPPDQATLETWRSQLTRWREGAHARYPDAQTPSRYSR